ncbi:MAG: FAD-dependent oxidoreductase [Clostridia bacterium]|nr:FAD-dependent oxidoreductase [Clostridia bacterium]
MKYETLFSPLQIGSITVKNRFVMPAMAVALAQKNGEMSEDYLAYFKARAKGGIGLIYTDFCRVAEDGSGSANQLGIYNYSFVGGLKKLTDTIHRYDSKIFVQLHHAGRMANVAVTGKQPIAPSALPVVAGGTVPREMTIEEIHLLREQFISAAATAKAANFDGVEIHCAHGYMLNQFVSPYSNHRNDEYGGNLENRLRIVKEIMEGVRVKCGAGYPISVRISAEEFVEDGTHIEEACQMAQLLERYGADLINVSAGGGQYPAGVAAPPYKEQGWLVPLAQAVKQVVSVPVIAVSLIRDFDYAENLIKEGKCDLVAMARPSLADPNYVNKLAEGREKEIKRCITCMHCHDSLYSGHTACAVNPVAGYEQYYKKFVKNGDERKVIVVGGGVAGCEAARVLALRNFKVSLYEKNDRLGGQMNIAAVPPHKYRLLWPIEYYEYNLPRLGVKVHLNSTATAEQIVKEQPYAVFIATGSRPIIPSSIELSGDRYCTAEQLLCGEVSPQGDKIAVIGAGMTGLEVAEHLQSKGKEVFVLEMLPTIGIGCTNVHTRFLIPQLKQSGMPLLTNKKLLAINHQELVVLDLKTNIKDSMLADFTVFAGGMQAQNALAAELARLNPLTTTLAPFEPTTNPLTAPRSVIYNIKLQTIGDASTPGNIAHAVREGFTKAFCLDDDEDIYE